MKAGILIEGGLAVLLGIVVCDANAQQDSAAGGHGTLVIQSPVQAVASINDQGSFLVMPGTDLRWNRIPTGTYRIMLNTGTQEWRENVQVYSGETATLVASLKTLGPPLEEGNLVVLPTALHAAPASRHTPAADRRTATHTPTAKTPPSPPPPATPSASEKQPEPRLSQRQIQQQRERDEREAREAQRRAQEERAQAQREAARREEELKQQQQRDQRTRRPRAH